MASAGKKQSSRASQPDIITREATIHLHKYIHGQSFKDRAPRAIKTIRAFATRMMNTKDVRLEPRLNKAVWSKGIRNVQRRIRVRFSRRRNEEEGAKEKFYTYVTFVPVEDFSGLQTEIVEA